MKNNNDLHSLFIDELRDMYSSEHQIVKALPKLIHAATSKELKEALSNHLEETKNQVNRIKSIFSILDLSQEEEFCPAMAGLLKEGGELAEKDLIPAALDAAIISAAQKVEHYEIASYGTLVSFAKQLELDDSVIDLLQDTLDEEGSANKTLTSIAEGSLFSSGVNKKASKH